MKQEYDDTSSIDMYNTYNNDTTTEGNNIPDSRIEKRLNRKQRRDIKFRRNKRRVGNENR